MRTSVYKMIVLALLITTVVEDLIQNHVKVIGAIHRDVELFLLISHIDAQTKSVYNHKFDGMLENEWKI